MDQVIYVRFGISINQNFLFLSETNQDPDFIQYFQPHFGFDNLVTVDPIRRSGGLALFYDNEYQVKVLYTSNRMIDVEAVTHGKTIFHFCVRRSSTETK